MDQVELFPRQERPKCASDAPGPRGPRAAEEPDVVCYDPIQFEFFSKSRVAPMVKFTETCRNMWFASDLPKDAKIRTIEPIDCRRSGRRNQYFWWANFAWST